jgi:hypothetical protein
MTGRSSVYTETEVTYEDGRKGAIKATLRIEDAGLWRCTRAEGGGGMSMQDRLYHHPDGRQIGPVLLDLKNITLRFGGVRRSRISASTSARARSAPSSGRTARANPRC